MWVAAVKQAGDMPQLVLQIGNNSLAVSFPNKKELNFTDCLFCVGASGFHLASLNEMTLQGRTNLI